MTKSKKRKIPAEDSLSYMQARPGDHSSTIVIKAHKTHKRISFQANYVTAWFDEQETFGVIRSLIQAGSKLWPGFWQTHHQSLLPGNNDEQT